MGKKWENEKKRGKFRQKWKETGQKWIKNEQKNEEKRENEKKWKNWSKNFENEVKMSKIWARCGKISNKMKIKNLKLYKKKN